MDPPGNELLLSTDAFRGWSVSLGGVPQTEVLYNSITFGGGSVDLFGMRPPRAAEYNIISGNFTPFLQNGPRGVAAISQRGTIPAGSRTLLVNSLGFSGEIGVRIDGSLAPMALLGHSVNGTRSEYDTFGVDVSRFGGMEVELEFAPRLGGNVLLDDIRFSTIPIVPEPSTRALIWISGVVLACIWGRRRAPVDGAENVRVRW